MSRVDIPSCHEIISLFGCECSIDDNLVQKLIFTDIENKTLYILIGLIDNSVKVTLIDSSLNTINNLFFESLNLFEIYEDKQKIKMVFNAVYEVSLEINLWKRFEINISGMSN